jgi:hypothetical protein
MYEFFLTRQGQGVKNQYFVSKSRRDATLLPVGFSLRVAEPPNLSRRAKKEPLLLPPHSAPLHTGLIKCRPCGTYSMNNEQ